MARPMPSTSAGAEAPATARPEVAAPADRWRFAAALGVAAVVLTLLGSAGAPAFDDWMFLGSRRAVLRGDGVLDYLLRSHNDHLMAGPVLWHHAMASVFGIGSYLPWMASIAAVHVGVACALRQLLVRLGVRPPLALALPLLLLCWGPATGPLLWGLDAVFALSVGLWLVVLLLVRRRDLPRTRAYLAAGVGAVAVTVHTTAVLGLVAIACVLLWQRRWWWAAVVASPLLPYGLWWATYGQRDPVYLPLPGGSADPGRSRAPLADQLEFAGNMWAATLDGVLPRPAGLVLLGAVVATAWAVAGRRGDPRRVLLGALSLFGLLFAATTARVRGGWGVRFAAEDRYVYVLALLTLPFVAVTLQHLWQLVARRWDDGLGRAVVLSLVGALAVGNATSFLDERAALHRAMHVMDDRVRAVAASPDLADRPGDERVFTFLWDLTVADVRHLVADGLLHGPSIAGWVTLPTAPPTDGSDRSSDDVDGSDAP